MWSVIDTGIASAEENMAIDAKLLESLADGKERCPILHLYEWEKPSATYGYFTDPFTFLSNTGVRQSGLSLAKRPTGGGIIFHTTDFAFSILVPAMHSGYSVNTLDNYAFINSIVIDVLKEFIAPSDSFELLSREEMPSDIHEKHFCMAKPTKYDVMLKGRKVGGAAQRRTKHGFLHQGSISLTCPDETILEKVLLPGTCVMQAMRANTCSLLGDSASSEVLVEARHQLRIIFRHLWDQKLSRK